MKIKKGDQVQIIKGKDRGKSGKVMRVFPNRSKIVIERLNLMKKHVRPKKSGEKGQRIEIPAPLAVSNVMLVCPKCGKLSRVKFKISGEKKVRICKKCESEI